MKGGMERWRGIREGKEGELERTRGVYQENEVNKGRLRELESTIVSKYEF